MLISLMQAAQLYLDFMHDPRIICDKNFFIFLSMALSEMGKMSKEIILLSMINLIFYIYIYQIEDETDIMHNLQDHILNTNINNIEAKLVEYLSSFDKISRIIYRIRKPRAAFF